MIAWHYTTGQKFLAIVESGYLKPTNIDVRPPEKPILWFSLNQKWENTANKAILEADGEIKRLSMQETRRLGGGLVRFGIKPNVLYLGNQLRIKASMSASIWKVLCKEGLKQNAKPSEWCGSLKPIPINKLFIEVMNKDFVWEKVS
jgi:hypothetical protein